MATDKLTARARSFIMMISLLGLLVLTAGFVGTTRIFSGQPANTAWTVAAAQATPAILTALVGLLIAVLPWMIWPLTQALLNRQAEDRWRHEQVLSAIESHRQLLDAIRETVSLSDAAKMITFRGKDREALRLAIREEMDKGDYEAAVSLVDEMERRFGYRQEAEQLRSSIEQNWRATRDQQVGDSIEHIETLMARFNWRESEAECGRLLKMNPDHKEARALPGRIEAARDAHKRDLLKQWKEAVAKDDLDRSVELLTELDQYLTPSEAKAYEEAARDVFRKRLQQLGVQYALHVHDKSWVEAARVSRQIIEEFPNTRIAAEVREKLPIIEQNIAGMATAI